MRNHFLRAKGQPQADHSWQLEYASFTGTPNNSVYLSQEGGLTSVAFKSDGTKMYTTGFVQDKVHEYALSTAYDMSTVSFTQSFDVSGQATAPRKVRFKSDGTKMYVLDYTTDSIYEYALSTAWDISTASYTDSVSVNSREEYLLGFDIASDGSKFWIVGNENDRAHEYTMSTAWDISTGSYTRRRSVYYQDRDTKGCFIKPDGSSFFFVGAFTDKVYEWILSTDYNIGSISLGDNFSVSGQEYSPEDIFFNSDGTALFMTGQGQDVVWKYGLTTAYDLSTASYSQPTTEVFSVGSQDGTPKGIAFKSDGTKMFVVGGSGDEINEYHLSTAWDISTASYDSRLYIGASESAPVGLYFKPDGTSFYVVGEAGDEINQWNCSTAWDISTASGFTYRSVSSQDGRPRGIYFKPDDGTKCYVLGGMNDTVYQYNVTVAWNAGYASYANKSFDLEGIEGNPYGLAFDEDGTRMYISSGGPRVHELALSTAWDVTTASHTHTFYTNGKANRAYGIAFKPDGSKFFVTDPDTDQVVAFTIS
tara:strand:+ start:4747 stop:6348 length:1602 start_codon:yes stop_codon:yes gene_type:complete